MDAGLNNHLKKISSELFIKHRSTERTKIDSSLNAIIEKLEEYFGDEIEEIIVFGSYARDTILPRKYDDNSDIDILIQFNTKSYDKLKPESYRSQLQKFALRNYTKSSVVKDHPSVVLELTNIKFDLVPAIFDVGIIWDSIEIPNKNGGWMETEPDKFNETLTKANKKYDSIVKPLIRLIKYWNASHDYPFSSYELEKFVANLDFSGDNYQSGFFHLVNRLPKRNLPTAAEQKVSTLKANAEQVSEHLDRQKIDKAKACLDRILPGFY